MTPQMRHVERYWNLKGHTPRIPAVLAGGHWFDSNSSEVMKIPRPRHAGIAQ